MDNEDPLPNFLNVNNEEKKNILVVDDDIAVLQSLEMALGLSNFNVYTVERGNDAIQIVKNNPGIFSIILLDLMMPDVSGYEVLISLNQIIKEHNIDVIIHSGIGNDQEKITAQKLGAKAFISKPHKITSLLEVINSIG